MIGASPVLRRRGFTKKWRSLNGRAIIGANDPGDLLGAASLAVKQLTRVARWKDVQNCTVLKSRSSVAVSKKEVAQTFLPLRHQRSKNGRGQQWPRSSFTSLCSMKSKIQPVPIPICSELLSFEIWGNHVER